MLMLRNNNNSKLKRFKRNALIKEATAIVTIINNLIRVHIAYNNLQIKK